jgi:FKBP-type peptidyl-prolyl cis-trans isomerase
LPLLSDEEQTSALQALRNDYRTRKKEARQQVAETNRREGEAFLAENKTKDGVITLDSGLQYKVVQPGGGPKPTVDDRVVCHHRGTLIDGTEFDSSFKCRMPATFSLKRVIKGWREALPLMPVGSKWQLFIPPSFAYGARGGRKNGIGPNATLVLEIDLVGIKGFAGEGEPKNTAESHGGSPP